MSHEKRRQRDQNNELNAHGLEHLSDKDLLFLIENYVTRRQDYEHIANLVKGKEDIIAQMVDSDHVFEKVMHERGIMLHASPYFLFTLLLRRIFKLKKDDKDFIDDAVTELNCTEHEYPWNRGKVIQLLNSTNVANYLANMLAMFAQTARLDKIEKDDTEQCRYIVDMIKESQRSDNVRRFYIYCYIGNYTLFFAGMFPEYIEHKYKCKKTLINSRYYIDFGKTYFGLASEHDMARRHELDETLHFLSEGFEIVAKLLQYMRKEYLVSYNLKV